MYLRHIKDFVQFMVSLYPRHVGKEGVGRQIAANVLLNTGKIPQLDCGDYINGKRNLLDVPDTKKGAAIGVSMLTVEHVVAVAANIKRKMDHIGPLRKGRGVVNKRVGEIEVNGDI